MTTAAAHTHDVQFVDAGEQHLATTLGMWVFLTTETLFFGVLFFAYAMARWHFPEAFAAASRHTNIVLGTMNTAVLLTSSFTMALAVRAAKLDAGRASARLLAITAALGCAFVIIKGTEYWLDFREHLVPGVDFRFDPAHGRGAEWFFGFYFVSTGIHAVHLLIGIALVAIVAWRFARRHVTPRAVEVTGLYWHFVDLVWIFLYPALYLVSRS